MTITKEEAQANIKLVRDDIADAPEEHFGMKFWNCGTSACIGGFIDRRFGEEYELSYEEAGNFVGLDWYSADDLFSMLDSKYGFEDATKDSALRVLDILAETGEVDWDRAIEETRG